MNRPHLYGRVNETRGSGLWNYKGKQIACNGYILEVNPTVSEAFAKKWSKPETETVPDFDRVIPQTWEMYIHGATPAVTTKWNEELPVYDLEMVSEDWATTVIVRVRADWYLAFCEEYGNDIRGTNSNFAPICWYVNGEVRAIVMPIQY